MSVLPGWYTPFRTPESWVGSLRPLVKVMGLDLSEGVERRVWELLNLPPQPQGPPGQVLPPELHLISSSDPLPSKKGRREGLESSSYIPSGILPSNWARKHRDLIPGVVVAFFKELDVQALSKLRGECAPHGTHILVMLLTSGDEGVVAEKAAELCAGADLPPKSFFILFTSHPDRVHASVHRLEKGIREACNSYYAGRVRRLKANKERTTQTVLQVRYNIKLGFFFEVRRDHVAALSHYEMAMDNLVRLGPHLQEVKVIAGLLVYRICRIHFIKREWNEAKSKFQRHVAVFKNSEGLIPQLRFEHVAYLEQQFHIFGDLAKQYFIPESNNAVDPVTYFTVAAKYAEERAIMMSKIPMSEVEQGDVSPDLNWEPHFLGQRPWVLDEEVAKVPLLQYLESKVGHSDSVINHLGLASEFCKAIGRLRMRCQLMCSMGEEFSRCKEYSRCTLLMGHVVREFGMERWTTPLIHAATVGLGAAMQIADIPSYLNFSVILLKRDLRLALGEANVERFSDNLDAVIRKQIPQHEGLNPTLFQAAFESQEEIKSYVGVHRGPMLCCWISFAEETASVQKATKVKIRLENNHGRALHIKSIAIQTNIQEYDVSSPVGKWLAPCEKYETTLEFVPLARDANKVIQLQVGVVDIGIGSISVLLHYSLITKTARTLWCDDFSSLNVLKIDGARPMLQCHVTSQEAALVGEALKVTVHWTNTDTTPASRAVFTFFLSTTNPQLVRLSPDPSFSSGGLSHSVEVDKLDASTTYDCSIYLRVSGECELRLISKAKYMDGAGQPMGTDHFVPINVICPFSISSKMTDTQGGETALNLFQPFILLHQIVNVTPTEIEISNIEFKVSTNSLKQLGGYSGLEFCGKIVVKPTEIVQSMQMLQKLQDVDLHTNVIANAVSLIIHWRRARAYISKGGGDDKSSDDAVVISTFPVALSAKSDPLSPSVYISGEFSPAFMKKPMTVTYMVYNRSALSQDLTISLESSEHFMNAGPKKTTLRLNPGDHSRLNYVLLPLKTGLVTSPKLLVEVSGSNEGLNVVRDHAKTIFIRLGND